MFQSNLPLLENDDKMKPILENTSIIKSHRQPKNLSKITSIIKGHREPKSLKQIHTKAKLKEEIMHMSLHKYLECGAFKMWHMLYNDRRGLLQISKTEIIL